MIAAGFRFALDALAFGLGAAAVLVPLGLAVWWAWDRVGLWIVRTKWRIVRWKATR